MENMEREDMTRQVILITDDSEINRMILSDMLEEDYELLEADSGAEALRLIDEWGSDIDLILLDFIMPDMNGFDVLTQMGRMKWKDDIPVIMISAEKDQSFIERAYKLGAVDYISRPFNTAIVRHRVDSVMKMHLRQRQLAKAASDHIIERYANNAMMVNVMSSIVEFRNGESGKHILHVQNLTDMLMREVINTGIYSLSDDEVSMLPVVAAMHDIGKISIPYSILNKPGRLTTEEFDVMKTHTIKGSELLESVELFREDPMIQLARNVCRWHHERYDGKGYPDGLEGDEIPLSAQIVSLADIYDALTSERCYKKAFTHEKAMSMILDGECGTFNPVLIDCMANLYNHIPRGIDSDSFERGMEKDIYRIIENTLRGPSNIDRPRYW